jgi:hypothetical protein
MVTESEEAAELAALQARRARDDAVPDRRARP